MVREWSEGQETDGPIWKFNNKRCFFHFFFFQFDRGQSSWIFFIIFFRHGWIHINCINDTVQPYVPQPMFGSMGRRQLPSLSSCSNSRAGRRAEMFRMSRLRRLVDMFDMRLCTYSSHVFTNPEVFVCNCFLSAMSLRSHF